MESESRQGIGLIENAMGMHSLEAFSLRTVFIACMPQAHTHSKAVKVKSQSNHLSIIYLAPFTVNLQPSILAFHYT